MENLIIKNKSKGYISTLKYSFLIFIFMKYVFVSPMILAKSATIPLEKAKENLRRIELNAKQTIEEARRNGVPASTLKNLKEKLKDKIKKAEREVEKEERLLGGRIKAEQNQLIKMARLAEIEKEKAAEAARIAEIQAEEVELWEEVERINSIVEIANNLKEKGTHSSTLRNRKQKQKKKEKKTRRKTDSNEIKFKMEREKEMKKERISIRKTASANIWKAATVSLNESLAVNTANSIIDIEESEDEEESEEFIEKENETPVEKETEKSKSTPTLALRSYWKMITTDSDVEISTTEEEDTEIEEIDEENEIIPAPIETSRDIWARATINLGGSHP